MQQSNPDVRRFAVAVKSSARDNVRADWQDAIKSTPDVELVGASANHAEVEATPEAAEALRNKLGADFFIEEDSPRQPI